MGVPIIQSIGGFISLMTKKLKTHILEIHDLLNTIINLVFYFRNNDLSLKQHIAFTTGAS